ncbi:MAG TPA: DegT/DnrJ/EryC1/StrS family aminotransferase, partial [Parvularculaceae bacterium]|nr:DegT/DnrJ/EryC1/StrS family aminotransferase [Parvularculaceae bacterium]
MPRVAPGNTSVWAQYTMRLRGIDRNDFRAKMSAAGVPTAVYYPRPLHRQEAFTGHVIAGGMLPVTDRLAGE